jgi:iron complex outermembrane receptor protein
MIQHIRSCLLASAGGWAMTGQVAHAQEQATAKGDGLEEIVVTAQKRQERLQDVPATIVAASSETLEAAGVTNVTELSAVIPGVTIGNVGSQVEIRIRGVGKSGGTTGQENAVAVFVDGVYMPGQASANFSFGTIERIEALKGPQGTLYGRNATGGAINIITRTPSYTTSVEGEIGYGNRDTLIGSFYATTGFGDNVAADLAFTYKDQGEGFGHNWVTGSEMSKARNWGVRSKLLLEPTDATRIILSGDYTENAGSLGVAYRSYAPMSRQWLTGQTGWPFGFYDIASDIDPHFETKNWGFSGRIEQDLGFATLNSISAYRVVDNDQSFDITLDPTPTFNAFIRGKETQFTQEIQLVSPTGGKLSWIAGLYYLQGKAANDPFIVSGTLFAGDPVFPFLSLTQDVAQKTKSYSAFAQGTYEILPRTNLTLGARYTIDKRRQVGSGFVTLLDGVTEVPVFGPLNNPVTFKKPTFRVSLDHKFSDEVTIYSSFGTGFQSGVFVTSGTPPTTPVLPETIQAYEVGLKTALLDRYLQFNISGFLYNYDNLQVAVVDAAGTGTRLLLNAAKARIYGVDFDFAAKFSDRFTVRGGGEWIHARYRDFDSAPCSVTNNDFPYGNLTVPCNVSGNRLERTPDFSFNIAADYRVPLLANGELATNLTYSYSGRYFWNTDNRLKQPALSLLNGQIKWSSAGDKYYVRVYGNNLTNKKYFTYASGEANGDIGATALGRTYGVALGFKY